MKYHDLVGSAKDEIPCAGQLAADATGYIAIWRAPYKCRVVVMNYVSTGAVTGNTTNHRNLNVDLAAGTEQANLDLTTGVDMTAGVAIAIPISATGGYIDLEEGATLLLESEKINTGVAVPIGNWQIEYQGR